MATSFPFRVFDNSGALVTGATVAINGTTLTAGTSASVTLTPLAGGSTFSAPVVYQNFGTGDYSLAYDTITYGEAYIPLTVSKSGSTITGANALIPIIASKDSAIAALLDGLLNGGGTAFTTAALVNAPASSGGGGGYTPPTTYATLLAGPQQQVTTQFRPGTGLPFQVTFQGIFWSVSAGVVTVPQPIAALLISQGLAQ